jgi:C4-dicarboxylate-specific signal transduction histidine kinase
MILDSSRLASLGEMSAGIAHEINNPLTIIHGKASQLLMLVSLGKATPQKLKDELTKIERTTLRIASIVRSLRIFSRKGEKDPFFEYSLHRIVEDVIELCRDRFASHGISLQLELNSECSVLCRQAQIGQILMNLLNNAFDAVFDQLDPWVKVKLFEKGGRAHVAVEDSGTGVPLAIRNRIMDPFFTTKDVGKGTGLGLSISRGLIEDHGGRLYLDDNSGHTCFVFELPIKEPVSLEV